MKNKFLPLILILFSGYSFSQTEENSPQQSEYNTTTMRNQQGDLKPGSGDFTFEVNFNPFSSPIISLNYVRMRKFLSDEFAARTGVTASYTSSGGNSTFEYGIFPGIEKHFAGTNRLSPFMGAEMILAGRSASYEDSNTEGVLRITGRNEHGHGFFSFGMNALGGCDYYFSKRIYMGLEAGYGFSIVRSSTITSNYRPTGGGEPSSEITAGSGSFRIGPNFNSAIRLGFAF